MDETAVEKSLPLRVDKPWGYEIIWAHSAFYAGKVLHVDEGQSLSRQYHRQKDEWMHVQSGRVIVEIGQGAARVSHVLESGEGIHLPAGVVHRLYAITAADVLEASTPELDDVVRLEDRYGRVDAPVPAGRRLGKEHAWEVP